MKTMLLALVLVTGAAQAQMAETTSTTASASTENASASEASSITTPAAPKVADNGEKKICKLERELGSNRAKRVCHSREELDAQSEASRAALSAAQRGH
ncbi:hypothetical protein DWG18_12105 [Lysobacter sp. TY2-98]|uniref:hypothetical protein n=1 Tax=Lysobacter sp. TY2-98 TaxID=2290922 RepID=UPI000E204B22|nr:hypothetical protein [Lysobacter sp. TY2-98]AXK72947.1 hypothetical protein DWG18_12105 [Lysobacter sp. TY2-98]